MNNAQWKYEINSLFNHIHGGTCRCLPCNKGRRPICRGVFLHPVFHSAYRPINLTMPAKRAKPFAANRASIKKLEAEGWTCCTVEQRLPHCFITRDAYNFGDILACSPLRGIMLVQATGGGNGPARIAKIKAEAKAGIWLASGGRIIVHDWRKRAGQKQRECVVFEIVKENVQ